MTLGIELLIQFVIIFFVARFLAKKLFQFRLDYKVDLDYDELMYKLSLMSEMSYHDIFIVAAEEWNFSRSKAERDFSEWVKAYGRMDFPHYVKQFLDSGREVITEAKVFKLI